MRDLLNQVEQKVKYLRTLYHKINIPKDDVDDSLQPYIQTINKLLDVVLEDKTLVDSLPMEPIEIRLLKDIEAYFRRRVDVDYEPNVKKRAGDGEIYQISTRFHEFCEHHYRYDEEHGSFTKIYEFLSYRNSKKVASECECHRPEMSYDEVIADVYRLSK